jgi:hypothetical protein
VQISVAEDRCMLPEILGQSIEGQNI